MTSPFTSPIDVFLLLVRRDHVLLALRDGTGYADGQWNVPSGKLEPGEHVLAGLLREAREEVGLHLAPAEPRLVTTVHYHRSGEPARVGMFFYVAHTPELHGQPVNAEPHKCAEIDWYPLDLLPGNTVDYTVAGVTAYLGGDPLRLHGWTD